MNTRPYDQRGAVQTSTIIIIILTIFVAIFGSLAIWAYLSYNEQKTDVDGKIALAESEARKLQAEEDDKKFAERAKEPYLKFVGPDDYGRVTFDYSKEWSVFESTDVSSGRGTYAAYLHRLVVPPVSNSQQFMLRVLIEEREYDTVVRSYDSLVKKGDLRSSTVSANGVSGTRLDGQFSKDIRGAAVIFKIRDKTLTIRTDADTFKPDFEKLIQTIEFNQ